jgi:hypothetical protein
MVNFAHIIQNQIQKKLVKKLDLLRKMTFVPLAKNVVGMVMFAMAIHEREANSQFKFI